MIVQTVVWTLLPDPSAPASTDGTTTLTLLASPRLGTDDPAGTPPTATQLSDYPDMVAWPSLQLSLAAEIVGSTGTTEVAATFVDPAADAALWQAIFPPNQQVIPFTFASLAGVPVTSYSAGTLSNSLADQYSGMLPPAQNPAHALADDPWNPIDQLLQTVGVGSSPESTPTPVTAAWTALAEFHKPPPAVSPNRRNLTTRIALTDPDDPETPSPEFHTVVGALADHPALATRLGLRRRVRVVLPAGLTGALTIRAVPTHSGALRDYRPRTSCVRASTTLTVAAADGSASSPYLPLDDTGKFTAIDVDTDRSGLALIGWAKQLNQAARDQAPPPLLPPALRSDGIFVAEADRDATLQQALARAAALNSDLAAGHDGANITLTADDVWHGYRPDVLDNASQRWYPLCQRQVTYTIAGGQVLGAVSDEGYVSAGMAHQGTDEQPVGLVHESLFRWNGWSLVAPPLGQMLDGNDAVADPTSAPAAGQPYHAAVVPAPGSLPALRYGRSYQLRVRLVDLAGSSVPFTSGLSPTTPGTPALRYHRYDPVLAPVVVPRRAVTTGESAYVLVVRTDNSNPDAPVAGPTCERHLLAPKAAVATLECHGVLDVTGQNRPDPAVYSLLFDHDAAIVTGTPDPGANGLPYVDADSVTLPWLPDPQAAGATITGLPATAQVSQPWPQGSTWYQRGSLRVVLKAGDDTATGAAVVDAAAATTTITIPPGSVIPVNLSSPLPAGGEELMGAWDWFAAKAATDVLTSMRAAAVAGTLGQLSPALPLQLVHAVRCPRQAPEFGELQAIRTPGVTSYLLSDAALQFDADTTHSVYAHVEWTDTVDDPSQPAPVTATRSADLLPDASQDVSSTLEVTHFIGDTRHHELTCTPVATSRFATYFAQHASVQLNGQTPAQVGAQFAAGTVIVRDYSSPATIFSIDRDVAVDNQHGTVTRLPGGAVPDGATVDVEFVVPPITAAGPQQSVTVLASARPAAPVVHSVVPAFAWQAQQSGSTIISRRIGDYLRVYLERPWFDSGAGELLAVLVAQEGVGVDDANQLDYVSHAAADAVFSMGGASGPLQRADLPRAVANALVSLPDAPQAAQIWAMGHEVQFDPVRRLWFSDIKIATAPPPPRGEQRPAHPFVRLKLARLQPAALPGLNISTSVDALFHKPRPDRTLTVSVTGNQASVTVTGPTTWGRVPQFTAAVVAGPYPGGDAALWDATAPNQVQLTGDPISEIRSGTVTLPAARGSTPMRLLVQEFEVLPGKVATPSSPEGGPAPTPGNDVQRLCYFDVIEL
ncbi:MAG: hypothetical protein ACLP75_05545 [Mycobacterium sp.]|uniref:hypothetical protein n=1 Tax=Mycobacterium sp. TaxID=1785 RepID=UPI003F9AC5F4